jgi:hypothetical protein
LDTVVRSLELAAQVEIPDSTGLSVRFDSLDDLDQLLKRIAIHAAVYNALKGVDTVVVPDPTLLRECFGRLDVLGTWVEDKDVLESWLAEYPAVDQFPVLDTTDLKGDLDRLAVLSVLEKRYKSLSDSVFGLEAEYQQVLDEEIEVQIEVQDIGACPTCARLVDTGHACGV